MRKVSLTQYRIIDGKWQFARVPRDSKGKPKPALVIIDGETVSSSTPGAGQFYLDYRDNQGKRIRRPCGLAPREALDAWNTQIAIINGTIESSEIDTETQGHATVERAINQFLLEVKATKSEETHRAYFKDAAWFKDKLRKHYVHQVDRADILRVFGLGRDEGLAQTSINRRVLVGLMALRNAGSALRLKKGDWPKTADAEVEVYSPEEMQKFFAACTDDERLLFQTYLCSGFRNREMATLTKDSVIVHANRLGVKKRSQYKFKPKNYECREVRIPASLMADLAAHMKKVKGPLVFPTKPHPKRPDYGGKLPDAHHLERCKEIAHRVGLNCGNCVTDKGKCKNGPYCEHWYLHKWRDTFATNMLRSGIDIKTLQVLLGHKNLSTTERYLRAVEIDSLSDKVESSALATLIA